MIRWSRFCSCQHSVWLCDSLSMTAEIYLTNTSILSYNMRIALRCVVRFPSTTYQLGNVN